MHPLVTYFDGDSDAMTVKHCDYYGVPDWLMKAYLQDLGGHATAPGTIDVNGCRVYMHKARPKHVGSLTIGGTTVDIAGTEGAIEHLLEELEWKTLRIGA